MIDLGKTNDKLDCKETEVGRFVSENVNEEIAESIP